MRSILCQTLTPLLALGFAMPAAAKTKLELVDEGLPLQELRPLERRVYILTLDGTWNQPAAPNVTYYVNFLFPNGASYSHRVLEEDTFRTGEVRCLIQKYQLVRNGLGEGGTFTVVVSAGRPAASATAPEVISNALTETWPMQRRITRFRPRSWHSEPEPVDAFRVPGEKDAGYAPPSGRPGRSRAQPQTPAPSESQPKAPTPPGRTPPGPPERLPVPPKKSPDDR